MPDTTPTPAPKRPRALPKVWQRFLYLEVGDDFFIGRCRYNKSGFFRACNGVRTIKLPPWRKVQTDVLVRDARPGGKSSPPFTLGPVVVDIWSPEETAVIASGKTHYVGDDCPGGHADKPVHNDNNVTGPTA